MNVHTLFHGHLQRQTEEAGQRSDEGVRTPTGNLFLL